MSELPFLASADELDALVAEQPTVLVNFTATWCGPCKAFAPVLQELADETAGAMSVVKVDIDDVPELKERYNLLGVPSTMVFSGGELMLKFTGAKNGLEVRELLGPLLPSS